MSVVVKSVCDSDVFTSPTSNIVSEKDILQENRKTRSSNVSKFFHLSPRSKKNAQKWDLTTAFANKLKLEDPNTETFDLGGAESTGAPENTCQVAKDAPISSPEKVALEIEEFLLRQQILTETAGATASLGDVWTPPPEYKAHIAVTESYLGRYRYRTGN